VFTRQLPHAPQRRSFPTDLDGEDTQAQTVTAWARKSRSRTAGAGAMTETHDEQEHRAKSPEQANRDVQKVKAEAKERRAKEAATRSAKRGQPLNSPIST
jgi:hypothetical protein